MKISKIQIAIIGLGYVGLPLAIEFGKKYKVLGFDINKERIEELSKGQDRTREANLVEMSYVTNLSQNNDELGLTFSSNFDDLKSYNIFIVTVPTPINKYNAPDLNPLLAATEMLGKLIKKNDIVCRRCDMI